MRRYALDLLGGDDAQVAAILAKTWVALEAEAIEETDERFEEWLFADVRHRVNEAQRFAGVTERFKTEEQGSEERADASGKDSPAETTQRLFARFTPKQQEMLRLKFLHGFHHEEIARITDLTTSHAAQLIHNSLGRLARALRARKENTTLTVPEDIRLTLEALGELDAAGRRSLEAAMLNPKAMRERIDEIQRTAKLVTDVVNRRGAKPQRSRRGPVPWQLGLIVLGVVGTLLAGGWWWSSQPRDEITREESVPKAARPNASNHASTEAVRSPEREILPARGGTGVGTDSGSLGIFKAKPLSTTERSTPGNIGTPAEATAAIAASTQVDHSVPQTQAPLRGDSPTGAVSKSEPRARKRGVAEAGERHEPAAEARGVVDARKLAQGGRSENARAATAAGGGALPPGAKRPTVDSRANAGRKPATAGTTTLEAVPQRDAAKSTGVKIESTETAAIVALRRALASGHWPRPEEVDGLGLQEYFSTVAEQREKSGLFAAEIESSESPWAPGRQLIRVAVRPVIQPPVNRPPVNVVFLLDVSGSMDAPNRLPLVQDAVLAVLEHLQPEDRVGVVTYAGESRVLVPSAGLAEAAQLRKEIQELEAKGQTNGGAGLATAFALARADRREHGEQVVILCTDGEFNMGQTSEGELGELIDAHAELGVRLAIFGFGRNRQIDPRLESLAARAQGGSGYVNTRADAAVVMLGQLTDLFSPVAEDLLLEVEFNPARVASHRRLDGDGGAAVTQSAVLPGEGVAAFFEYEPLGSDEPTDGSVLLQTRLSYRPAGAEERIFEENQWRGADTFFADASSEFKFTAVVARFAELLRGTPAEAAGQWDKMEAMANEALADDAGGFRQEFLAMLAQARAIQPD
ncbi:MAG: DUF3520 domain-containing protein [Candidatus Didemnitutus sp.]|nr:DUF3520 domain-containing protein [Candidatus Didemnitutus sp.]